eukprot:6689504-Pyramimonas_sp.AAC.1
MEGLHLAKRGDAHLGTVAGGDVLLGVAADMSSAALFRANNGRPLTAELRNHGRRCLRGAVVAQHIDRLEFECLDRGGP